ncbi:MAG: CoF synthetase, partial [Pseudomonadota bacterium]
AAETLDPIDRPIIKDGLGCPLDQIYMATEGLLGATCRHGQLHLAEDSIFFAFEDVGDGLVNPVITSFRRQTQILARYRMNDLLRLSDTACPCGSPLRVADEIVGRMDDCFHIGSAGGAQIFTPDILRNAVLDADQRISDFRLIQTGDAQLELVLPPDLPKTSADAAKSALLHLMARRGTKADVTCLIKALPLDVSRKLRRVENRVTTKRKA